ncbi:MAG TPA: sulfite exporter TauE/SafE family protein [bacterium]|nr:sulfite exporter TauE/SafE family protein [bacterium]HOC26232.1 sulfite exporter TauE/SafE family protein [bacterium]HOH07176.1 sulfite exporter TauE/SafE family protein [bacterium]HOY43275.1 sulfite exporter TauE/SafE family protein [bacterium]HPG82442.1 sulfite exporter TauE/SafE family protein [bacterium]
MLTGSEPSLWLYILLGLAAGTLSGFFGIGGGIIIVPALVYFAGFSQQMATGTSLAVLLPPVGLAAVLVYYQNNNVNLKAAVIIAICLFIGAWAASHIANRLNQLHLRLAFGVVMVLLGLFMVFNSWAKLHK